MSEAAMSSFTWKRPRSLETQQGRETPRDLETRYEGADIEPASLAAWRLLMEQLISSADPAIAFKQHALTLVKRLAGQVKPDPEPFAIETTIRQLDRYCMWWTEANGFFHGAASDVSLPAAELTKRLHGWNGSQGSGRRTCGFFRSCRERHDRIGRV
jgi:hypothetical protein